jgi:hypothetical protein
MADKLSEASFRDDFLLLKRPYSILDDLTLLPKNQSILYTKHKHALYSA